jgi:molybdopterin-guanine dinucleotide biosynthesis protein A
MTLAAVLLAGGESRRMGRDKATLAIDGIPLWERQLALLRALTPRALFVSARQAPAWLPRDARFIADPTPPRGPLGGLAATLAAMNATHLLALAVDMPAMNSAHLAALWRAALPGCGVLPAFADHTESLPAIYPAEALPFATALLAVHDVSLKTFTRELVAAGCMKLKTIAPPDAILYANCNAPAEWQRHAHHD